MLLMKSSQSIFVFVFMFLGQLEPDTVLPPPSLPPPCLIPQGQELSIVLAVVSNFFPVF